MLFSSQTNTVRLLCIVLCAHILALSSLLFTKQKSPASTHAKPLSVVTIQMKEITSASAPAPSVVVAAAPVVQEALPAKAPPPPEKKESKKKSVAKKNEVKSQKSVATKGGVSHEKELLALLQNSLDQSKSYGGKVEKKEIRLSSEGLSFIGSFEEELIVYLQNQLSVPEPGVVTLLVTLTAGGGFMGVEITKCEAKANRNYLESVLPKLAYPSFTDHFPKEKSRCFSLTFHVR